jgi:hypothetical protein
MLAVEANPDYWSAMVGLGGALLIAMVLALRDFRPTSPWGRRLAPFAPWAAYLLPFIVVALGLFKLRSRADATASDEWLPAVLLVASVGVLLGMVQSRGSKAD